MASKSDLISRYRQGVGKLIETMRTLNNVLDEFVVLDYASELTPDDFTGENADVTLANLAAAKTAIDALNAQLAANNKAHLASLYRVKK